MATVATGKKKFWQSKTFWTNVLAIACLVVQDQFGFALSAETQVSILAGVNMALRLITKEEITWS